MAFVVFRRLGVSVPLGLAAIGVYGTLNATAQTATYLGASFDVLCLFFILGSALALFSQKRWANLLSAILFLLSLRSKEFAIVVPFLFVPLIVSQLHHSSVRQVFVAVVRRLWMHFAIAIVFAIRYLTFVPQLTAEVGPQNPYHMHLGFDTWLKSMAYYTALVFGADQSPWAGRTFLIGMVLVAIVVYALIRRRMGLLFGISGYILTLLPVALMPNLRSLWYVYAPQVFLILAMCLLLEDILALLSKHERVRWTATAMIALACFLWGASFRRSSYFENRVNFTLIIRRTYARTARDAEIQIPTLSAGARVYVDHGEWGPWPFVRGLCDYLEIVNRQKSINCVMNESGEKLWNRYEREPGEKYFVNYHADGSLTVGEASEEKNDCFLLRPMLR
jgi:hypothetical protein